MSNWDIINFTKKFNYQGLIFIDIGGDAIINNIFSG